MKNLIYEWPLVPEASPHQIRKLYESGFPGCHISPAATYELVADPAVPNVQTFSAGCPHLRDLHKSVDKALLFLPQVKHDRGVYESEAQETGNCVGRGSQNARCTTNSVEIVIGGEAEQYERESWESTYAFRGHGGAGMDPALAARVDATVGFLWRHKYPFADLSRQNTSWAVNLGGRTIPDAVKEEMGKHKVGKWIFPETGDEALDLFAAGYACHSGQMAGFSSRPNSEGYHPLTTRWNHDMASAGYDLSRDLCPVQWVAVPNSWGDWNQAPGWWPTDIWGPPIKGLIICRLEDWVDWFVDSRSIFFYCDIEGIPAKKVNWRIEEWL